MDMRFMSGAATIAMHQGMTALQERKDSTGQMILAAKQGKTSYTDFAQVLRQSQTQKTASTGKTVRTQDEYLDHLKEKYGVVRIESIGKDQHSLDKVGATMGGTDVVIAPNMLEKMANDPDTADRIEGTIDYFFNNIPKFEAEAAAMGLTFESCGCVVHEDGTVTYICGGGDPPERVAEVDRINREKRQKQAEMREAGFERSREASERMRELTLQAMERRSKIAEGRLSPQANIYWPTDWSRSTQESVTFQH